PRAPSMTGGPTGGPAARGVPGVFAVGRRWSLSAVSGRSVVWVAALLLALGAAASSAPGRAGLSHLPDRGSNWHSFWGWTGTGATSSTHYMIDDVIGSVDADSQWALGYT